MTSMSKTVNGNQNTDKRSGQALREGLSEVKRDASTIKDDLGVLRDDASELGSHATHHAIEAVRSGAQSASDLAHSAGDTARKYHTAMREHVSQRPTTAILLALGVGVIAGRILSARR